MERTILFTLILVTCIISKNTLNGYLPNLPVGEFKVYARAIIKCKPTTGNIIEFNLYMYKESVNTSEIKGNITMNKPFDDSLNIHLNMAVKDSVGGWKDNAYFFQTAKACTQAINFFDPALSIMNDNFHYFGTCPFPIGVYVSKGLDFTSLVSKINLPKQFFYGTYKSRLEFTNKNKKHVGCSTIIIDVKRSWETE